MLKLARFTPWKLILAVILILSAFAWRPEWIIIVAPGLRVTSAYCSRWKAAADERVFLDQVESAGRIRAASRLLRSEGDLDLWQTPAGEFWIPKGSESVLTTLLAQQQRSIYGPIRQGDVVIDCGAHVGTYARTAFSRGASKVIAVEPSPEALACLRKNLAPEIAAGRAVIVPKGIWDYDGDLTFYLNGNGEAAGSFVNHNETSKKVTVPVTTLDSIATQAGLQSVHLIKADVKGATMRALQGGKSMIARFHPRLALATEEPPEDPSALADFIARSFSGYRPRCGPCFVIENEIRTDVMFFE